ncbi:MAG: phosphate ABC transporter substrate-binding protein [Mariprofundaceae bacterium]|nr:phosphate ABC transporter substrate-binding protein [Mariprofundaceae bacterium]
MRKPTLMLSVTILALCIFVAPGSSTAGITLHAVGSTTVLPVVSTAANIWHQQHPDVRITVSGGGSGVGIASMIQGTADIGMASREIDSEETAKLKGNVDVFTIARDAVAVVVSKAVYLGGVHQLSLKQIAAIYRGNIKNWQEVGGPDARIFVIDKEASRGTRHVFAEAVLGDAHARAPGASVISGSNNEEQSLVAHSDSAIGMLSNAWLNDAVRGVAVGEGKKAVLPDIQHVRDGSYPISRSLHVILAKKAAPEARAFVDFLLSSQGQDIVKKSGYLPVR